MTIPIHCSRCLHTNSRPATGSALSARALPLLFAGIFAASALPLNAQEGPAEAQGDYLEGLKSCQTITDNSARLACFDAAVGNIVTASDVGDVQVIDREDVRQTRRSLFGFSLPDLGIFGGEDEENSDELFTTTVQSVRYLSGRKARLITAEGAVWEIKNIPRRLRDIEPGDSVEFKQAAMGYFFLRIDGQMGVKGRRVE